MMWLGSLAAILYLVLAIVGMFTGSETVTQDLMMVFVLVIYMKVLVIDEATRRR